MLRTTGIALGASLMVASCANSQLNPAQRNAAIGTAAGAAIGSQVTDDETTGAVVGGLIGGAVGAYTGCRQQGGCYVGGREVNTDRQYDEATDRSYFYDPASGNTYYANGDLRSRGE